MDDKEIIDSRLSELLSLLKRMEDASAKFEDRKDLHTGWPEAITALYNLIKQIQSKKVMKLETVRNVLLLVNITLNNTMGTVQTYARISYNPMLKKQWISLLSDLLDLSNVVNDLGTKF